MLTMKEADSNCHLWSTRQQEEQDLSFAGWKVTPHVQASRQCVRTVLGMLTGRAPEEFDQIVNTQDPVSWSDALERDGMKLAYCANDVRKLKHYADELISLNGLFTLSYYTSASNHILRDPHPKTQWLCSSHIVILHGSLIYDPASGEAVPLKEHKCLECHTKRIFRVVPLSHPRGL